MSSAIGFIGVVLGDIGAVVAGTSGLGAQADIMIAKIETSNTTLYANL
jgi:hypothetical protein